MIKLPPKSGVSADEQIYQPYQSDLYNHTTILFAALFLQILLKNVYSAPVRSILLLQEARGTNYRDTVELVKLLDPIRDLLQLDQVPHYSTHHKFMTQFPSPLFVRILKKTLMPFYSVGTIIPIVATDASGFTSALLANITPSKRKNFGGAS
jgi:hypothetical protein